MRMRERQRFIGIAIVVAIVVIAMVGIAGMESCDVAWFSSYKNDIKGQLIGISFEGKFYDNYGELYLTVHGDKVNMSGNVEKEATINSSSGDIETAYGLSSVVTITIDGHQMTNCGSTAIFAETGLEPDAEFTLEDIQSSTDGSLSDNTLIAGLVNRYKNFFGKPMVVVIQSQLGNPICAYSGEDVYWEVCDNLPKTTKVMIDGKALYVHRSNFHIIDKALIE